MRQLLLFVPLQLLGTALAMCGLPAAPHLCGALGFPLGLAALVIVTLLATAFGVPFTAASVAIAIAALAIGAGLALRRRPPAAGTLPIVAGWAAAFGLAAAAASAVSWTTHTTDSHVFLAYARLVADDAGFAPGLLSNIASYGVFVIVAQALAGLLGMEYLYSLSPVLGLSFAASFAALLVAALRALAVAPRRRAAIAALVTIALFSTWFVQFHALYVHTNLGSALYLFVFVGLFWLAEVARDARPLPLAFLALAAFAIQRVEAPLVAALFAALMMLPTALSRRATTASYALFFAIVALWNLVLAATLGADDGFLTPARAIAMVVLLAALFVVPWLRQLGPLAWLAPRGGTLAALALALALALAFALKPGHMWTSTVALATNLTAFRHWGVVWPMLALLMLGGALAPRVVAARPLALGLILFFALILVLVAGRVPYRVSPSDSAVRMALHVVAIGFFYLGLKLGALAASPSTTASVR